MTAAHCIAINSAPTVSVSVGSSKRRGQDSNRITHRALRILIHPDYDYTPEPFQIQNDIAIIRTITQIRFSASVQPIAIGNTFVPSGSQVLLTGWGLLGNVR